jgi:NH3-dependent NAD+ synthetase
MAKHRLRMVLLAYRADIDNLMVVGAANKTEWLAGTFSRWGCDHCADACRSSTVPASASTASNAGRFA